MPDPDTAPMDTEAPATYTCVGCSSEIADDERVQDPDGTTYDICGDCYVS